MDLSNYCLLVARTSDLGKQPQGITNFLRHEASRYRSAQDRHAERGMILEYEHPQVGRVRVPGNPIKLWEAPGPVSRSAPGLGEHTEQVLSELLGMAPERIEQLRAQGAIA